MPSSSITRLLGINWKTTLAGISMIVAVIGKILLAYRTKDFAAIFSNGQELFVDIGLLLGALGLMRSKDNDTTGTGETAKKIEADGTVTKADGTVKPG